MQFFIDIFNIFKNYWQLLLSGMANTLLISLVGTVVGLVIGLAIGILRTVPLAKGGVLRALQKGLNGFFSVYIEIFRGTPMMVQAMVIYWGYAFATGGNTLPLLGAGMFIVSINTGAYMAEIARGGILSIDRGQFEGAAAIGMTHVQTMIFVVIPQVMRNILPSISNEFVINIKDTSVLNVIGVAELYYYAAVIKRFNLQMFQNYFVVCVLYFLMTFAVTKLLRLCERKLEGKENYTVFGSQSDPNAEIHIKVQTTEGC